MDRRDWPPRRGQCHYFAAGEPVPYWLGRVDPPFAMLVEFGVAVRVLHCGCCGAMQVQPLGPLRPGESVMVSDGSLTGEEVTVIGAPTILYPRHPVRRGE